MPSPDHTIGSSTRLSPAALKVGYGDGAIISDLDIESCAGPAEQLPELDADFIFATYRTDTLETPASSTEQLNAVVPDFCQYLTAYQNNQLITIPREEASSNSFYALGAISFMVIPNISGRSFAPYEAQ